MSGTASPRPPAAAPGRARCGRCDRPWPRGCLCAFVRPTDNQVAVLVLQHPSEAAEAKGSARLLALSLARCRVEVGGTFEPGALHALLHARHRSRLLYPEVEAAPAPASLSVPPSDESSDDGRPLQLVVLDATWRKSLRMLLAHPALQALPRMALPAPPALPAGRPYAQLRPSRRPGQLSTLEAVCAALGALEGDDVRYDALRGGFDGFVARSLRAREGG